MPASLPSASTTSATTMPPVIGLRRDLARDIRTSGMPVDDGLDLLGMNLQAADIDDAAAAADEIIAVATQLDHVAGIDEAVVIGERSRVAADIGVRGALRADPQRAVDHLHLDAVAVLPDQRGRESLPGRH